MKVQINLTDEEMQEATIYSKKHALSLEEAFRNALFEKIEEQFDVELAETSFNEFEKNSEFYSHDEAGRILQL